MPVDDDAPRRGRQDAAPSRAGRRLEDAAFSDLASPHPSSPLILPSPVCPDDAEPLNLLYAVRCLYGNAVPIRTLLALFVTT